MDTKGPHSSCQTGEECLSGWQTLHYNFPSQTQAVLSSLREAPYFYKCLWAFLKSLSVFISLSEEEASGLSPLKWEASRSENPGPGSCSLTQRAQRTLSIYVFLWVRVCSNLGDNAAQTWAKYLFTPTSGCISVLGREAWLAARGTTEAALSNAE